MSRENCVGGEQKTRVDRDGLCALFVPVVLATCASMRLPHVPSPLPPCSTLSPSLSHTSRCLESHFTAVCIESILTNSACFFWLSCKKRTSVFFFFTYSQVNNLSMTAVSLVATSLWLP